MLLYLHLPVLLLFALFASRIQGIPGTDTNHGRGDALDHLAANGLENLKRWEASHPPKRGACSLKTASVRKEWSALSLKQRRAYIDAVLCLTRKPTKASPATKAKWPGVRTRLDDFAAAHMDQVFFIHVTGNFLGWHRNFMWLYEKALKEECGYQGPFPYWNWGDYVQDLTHSAVFDGSQYSMSSDGAPLAHTPIALGFGSNATVGEGNGGGCLISGPFKDLKVTLGPSAFAQIDGIPPNPQVDGFGYNPRCIRRDLSHDAALSTTTEEVVKLIRDNDDYYWFAGTMQGDFQNSFIGVHAGGHFTVGGDPQGDLFTAPSDPIFFLHHTQIDRVWWIWQMQDIAARQHAMKGVRNFPGTGPVPSPNSTLEDDQFYGDTGQTVKLKTLLNTLDGPFCYIYA